jgi:FkbM family methyltransferase
MQSRRDFLVGAGAGVATVKLAEWGVRAAFLRKKPVPGFAASFAQSGEDLVANYMLKILGIARPSYLDIGAYKPIEQSNTYLFYLQGGRGVLVEPNVALCEQLTEVRPEDKVLNVGIGISTQKEADYYVLNEAALNTFDRDDADQAVQRSNGTVRLERVIRMPLVNINEVLAQHFASTPDFLSIDTEGLDLPILQTLDFERHRPIVICAETQTVGTPINNPAIADLVTSKGYEVRGQTFVNTLFVDKLKLQRTLGGA